MNRNGRKLFSFVTVCCCSGLALGARAADATEPAAPPVTNEVRRVTLQECFEMALAQNLDLKIERLNPSIARGDLGVAEAGYEPAFKLGGSRSSASNPLGSGTDTDRFTSSIGGSLPYGLSYDVGGDVSNTHGLAAPPYDSASGSVGVSLTVPVLRGLFFDSTRYNILVARNRIKVSEWRLQDQVMAVLTSVEQAYYNAILARESYRVQEEGLRLAQRLAKENKLRVQIGTMAKLEEKQSESQAAAREADLSTALRSLTSAQNKLKQLLTGDYASLHEVVLDPSESLQSAPVPLSVQESWRKGLSMRPDLVQARVDLERQGITVKYDKNQLLPDLSLSGGYSHNASGTTSREFSDAFGEFASADRRGWNIGANLTVPLGNKAARERYRQSKSNQDQLVLTLKKKEQSAMVEIDEAMNLARSSFAKIASSRKARGYAEEALDAEQKKLAAGKSTSFVVLQLQRELISAKTDEIGALADYNNALSALYRAEGSTLERHNIGMNVK